MSKSISIKDVFKEIEKSDQSIYHRGKSWEHCYAFFRKYKKLRNDKLLVDYAALHLGFFLASWGMLRGSSFLLQKDYKFYTPIVCVLIKPKYNKLWNFNFLEEGKIKENLDCLLELKEDLKNEITKNNLDNKIPTDLLITKIIMVTMGCVPAYDRYFKIGLNKKFDSKSKIGFGSFNNKSFKNLLDFVGKDEELKKIYSETHFIKGTKIKYPPMKLLDLYFWLLGSQE